MNETSTTSGLFLGLILSILLIGGVISVRSGEVHWPGAQAPEVEEDDRAGQPLMTGRPTFRNRAHPKLRRDGDDVVEPASGPIFTPPRLANVGFVLCAIGLVWMVVEAFSLGTAWGYAVLIGNFFGSIAFFFAYPRRGWRPLGVQLGGAVAFVWASLQTL